MIVKQVPVVTEDGDICFHGLEGFQITVQFETDTGLIRNMTGSTITFELDGFIKELELGDTPYEMVLSVNQGELPDTIGRVVPFVLLDKTSTVPTRLWSGRLVQLGWRE